MLGRVSFREVLELTVHHIGMVNQQKMLLLFDQLTSSHHIHMTYVQHL